MSYYRLLLLTICTCLSLLAAKAQNSIEQSFDYGKTQVSDGNYLKSNTIGKYQWKKYQFSIGLRSELISNSSTDFSGSFLAANKTIHVKNWSFLLEGKYSYNRFSKIAHEQSAQLSALYTDEHWEFTIGSQIFRQYRISKFGQENYDLPKEHLTEFVNLMYRIQYSLNEKDSQWNVGIVMTNIDYFIINQETNPLFYLYGEWQISPQINWRTEFWYISSGAMNISVNYFGHFFRTGLQWDIN